MNGIVAWFARNSVAANLLMVVAFVGGIIAFNSLERRMFPVVAVNGASVTVVWQGASPQDAEEQIITRIEEVVADLDGLDRITSIAYEGGGTVNIRGRDDVDMNAFLDEVKLRVDQINNLPRDAFRPQVQRWEQRNWYFGMTVYGDMDARTLKRVADNVRDEVAKITGAELAVVQGVLPEEVSIEVSEENLRRYSLSFNEVADAVRASSINQSGGTVQTQTGSVGLATRQLADTADQFGSIIIRQSTDQGMIRVKDIATVIDGFVDEDLKATFDDRPTAFVFIPSPDKMQIIEYTDAIKDFIERANDPANAILPEAAQIEILWDDSKAFEARMSTISNSAGLGAIMVLAVLILFLRPMVALWVTVGIATAFAGGIMLLPFFGVSFNFLSLFAVLLVIGVVVDDAIIVGENIHKEVESGRREGLDAAVVGTQLVLKPVVFGVLTTIIAFLPWAFLTGPTRAFTQQITFVVVAALTFSLIESMLILPAHLSHLKKQRFDGNVGGFLKFQRRIADSLLWFANNVYKPVLEGALKFRYATIALFMVMFFWAITLVSMGFVAFRFMPEIQADLIQVNIELADGTPFSRTEQVRDQLQEGIELLQAESGRLFPNIEGNIVDGASVVASGRQIQAWVGITPPENRPKTLSSKEVTQALRDRVGAIPDAEDISFDFTFNENNNGISIALNHPDLDLLRQASEELKTQLSSYDTTFDVRDNLSSAAEEVRIAMKPGAESLGITLAQVSDQIRQAYFGVEVQRLPRDGEDVRVMVRLPEAARESLDSLRDLRLRTPDGREIPMSQVADFSYGPGINRIVRRDRLRSVSVQAELAADTRGQIFEDLEANFWPSFEARYPQITRGNIGGAEEQARFFSEVVLFMCIALFAMYILLAIAFQSYAQPFLIMTAIPFAYAGAVFGHLIMGLPMAMFSFFGIAAAAGVVINDNLVLIDYINRRRADGAGAVQALVDAGVSRFRPILLTSITTFVGVLPLLADRSVDAQFLKPMVVSLGFAVAFALFISLFMVPTLYAVGVEVGRVFRWSWGGRPYRGIGDSYSGEVTIDEEELIGTSLDTSGRKSGSGNVQPAE